MPYILNAVNKPVHVEIGSQEMLAAATVYLTEAEASKVADALAACNWANAPIGNKAILAQAIALLRADQHQGALLGYIWPEEIDGPNRCRVMTVSRPGDFMPNMIPVYQVPQLIQGEPAMWANQLGDTISSKVKSHNLSLGGAPAGIAKSYTQPLYTNVDPGEVERLSKIIRDLNDERDEIGAEAGRLRAQLACLTEAANSLIATVEVHKATHEFQDDVHAHEKWAMDELENALSASADPAASECSDCQRLEQQLAERAALSAPPALDERAAFEAWVITRKVCTHKGGHLKKDSAGNYLDYRINDRWLTWQARAVHDQRPVITLPEYSDQRGGHFYQGWNELLYSLAAQIGVKLTPKIRPYNRKAGEKA